MATVPYPFPYPSTATYPHPLLSGGYYPSPFPYAATPATPSPFPSSAQPWAASVPSPELDFCPQLNGDLSTFVPPPPPPPPAYSYPPPAYAYTAALAAPAYDPSTLPSTIHLPYSQVLAPPPETTAPPASESPVPTNVEPNWPPPATAPAYDPYTLLSTTTSSPNFPASFSFPYSQVHAPSPESTAPPTPSPPIAGALGSTPTSAQPWVASSPNPGLDPVRVSQLLSAEPAATATVPPPTSSTTCGYSTEAAATLHQVQRELLNIQARLRSAMLKSRVSQCPVSTGKRSTSASRMQLDYAPVPLTDHAQMLKLRDNEVNAVQHHATVPSAVSYVAPQVVDEMPTPKSCPRTYGTSLDDSFEHQTPIQSSCVQVDSTKLSEQTLDGWPQAYGLHNLNRQSVCLADGTEHSYFTLPADYPLERVVPEPVFDVYDGETEGCSSKSVDVFADTPGQQIYEEEPQRGEPLLKCLSKALETEHTSACVNIISDVRDLPLELQQQDDEKACNRPVLKASDSVVTSPNQLSIDHTMREIRLLWDPGATEFHVLFLTSVGATKLQCLDVYKLAIVHKVAVQFGAKRELISESAIMCSCAFGFGWKEVNAAAVLVLLVPCSKGRSVAKHSMFLSNGGTSITKRYSPKLLLQLLSAATTMQVTEQRHPLEFSIMVDMLPSGSELDGQLASMSHGTSIHSPEWVRHTVTVLSRWFPSFEMAKLQWDPGTRTTPSMCLWLQGLTPRIETGKTLYCLQISELATWQSQVTRASYVWDPGTALPWYMPNWWLLFTEEKIMVGLILYQWSSWFSAMHYCHFFQKCSEVSSQFSLQSRSWYNTPEVVAVYQVSNIQLPMRKTTQIWDLGTESLLFLYKLLHIHMIQLVDSTGTTTHACYFFVAARLAPTQVAAYCPSNIKVLELTSRYLVFHPNQIDSWASTTSNGIASPEYAHPLGFHHDQWEFFNQQDVQGNYSAHHLLLFSQQYLKTREIGTFFITFLPP